MVHNFFHIFWWFRNNKSVDQTCLKEQRREVHYMGDNTLYNVHPLSHNWFRWQKNKKKVNIWVVYKGWGVRKHFSVLDKIYILWYYFYSKTDFQNR